MMPTVRSLATSVPLPTSPTSTSLVFHCAISPRPKDNNADVRSGTPPKAEGPVGSNPPSARKDISSHILTSPQEHQMRDGEIVNEEMTARTTMIPFPAFCDESSSAVDWTGHGMKEQKEEEKVGGESSFFIFNLCIRLSVSKCP